LELDSKGEDSRRRAVAFECEDIHGVDCCVMDRVAAFLTAGVHSNIVKARALVHVEFRNRFEEGCFAISEVLPLAGSEDWGIASLVALNYSAPFHFQLRISGIS
jgi:hypothetical protein